MENTDNVPVTIIGIIATELNTELPVKKLVSAGEKAAQYFKDMTIADFKRWKKGLPLKYTKTTQPTE